jgi:hypothetical protein
MAWTAPTTRADEYVVTAATWNTDVVDNLAWLGTSKPHGRAYNSANISLTTATLTILTLDSERVDVGGGHSTAVNTGRFTVPAGGGGFYHLTGCASFAGNATGFRELRLVLNGATSIAMQRLTTVSAAASTVVQVSADYQLVAGDYVEMRAQQTSGGALNVEAAAAYSPEMSWHWIST